MDSTQAGTKAAPALTDKQREIYQYLFLRIEETGTPPAFQEIAGRFLLGVSAVECHIKAIAKKGYCSKPSRERKYDFKFKPDGTPFRGFKAI